MAETEGVTRRFDPRFSPAFQPGYDPRVHREEPPSAPLREEPRRDWPETRRDVEQSRRDAPDTRDGLSIFAIPDDAAEEPAGVVAEDAEPAPWWRRVNPWFVVLWVLGAVFILGGVWLVSVVEAWSQASQGFDGGGFLVSMIIQISWIGVPMLITLGLATLTSTVVILAARWRRPG
jgi:hypothetical protein